MLVELVRNQLDNQERLDIEKYLGHVITPYYSMAGGSVISTKVWKQNRKNIEINKVLEFFDVWPDSRSGDAFLSMVLWYFKMHIEDWEELYESHMGDRKWVSICIPWNKKLVQLRIILKYLQKSCHFIFLCR